MNTEYVNATIIDPLNNQWNARIRIDSTDDELIKDLVKELDLPINQKYTINNIGGIKIKEGCTIQLWMDKTGQELMPELNLEED